MSTSNTLTPGQRRSSSIGPRRAGKACEPCRTRKTRCNIDSQAVCSECIRRESVSECHIREKARPGRVRKPILDRHMTSAQALPDSEVSPTTIRAIPSYTAVPTILSLTTPAQPASGPSGVAWPNRDPPPGPASGADATPIAPELAGGHRSAPAIIEAMLEEQARVRYGLSTNARIPPESVFDARHSRYLSLEETGLDPSSPAASDLINRWMDAHFSAIHHNTPFLHRPQVLGIASKLLSAGSTSGLLFIPPDELALLYATLSLGSLREETYDVQSGNYRTIAPTLTMDDLLFGFSVPHQHSPADHSSPSQPAAASIAQSLFRLSQEALELVEDPSEVAVQALFLLHMFVSNTSMGRRSRDYVARAVMMSHEVGLHRRVQARVLPGPSGPDEHAIRRRAMLYLYVYFSDVYLSALESRPPLIKRHDYDSDVFAPIAQGLSWDVDAPSGTPMTGLRGFVDLVTTIGGALERLHSGYQSEGEPSIELVLQLDGEMDALRVRLGTATFGSQPQSGADAASVQRTATAGSLLRQIHYNWSRIALRAPFLRHPLLKHSALAICARSALTILHCHRHVILKGFLNLPWMQLRRIATSIHIVFIALWEGEITHADAEVAVQNTLDVLCVICTRWKSATGVARLVVELAGTSGIKVEAQSGSHNRDHPTDLQANTGISRPSGTWLDPDFPTDNLDILASLTMPDESLPLLAGEGAREMADINFGGDELFAEWDMLHQSLW